MAIWQTGHKRFVTLLRRARSGLSEHLLRQPAVRAPAAVPDRAVEPGRVAALGLEVAPEAALVRPRGLLKGPALVPEQAPGRVAGQGAVARPCNAAIEIST